MNIGCFSRTEGSPSSSWAVNHHNLRPRLYPSARRSNLQAAVGGGVASFHCPRTMLESKLVALCGGSSYRCLSRSECRGLFRNELSH